MPTPDDQVPVASAPPPEPEPYELPEVMNPGDELVIVRGTLGLL